MAQGEALSNGDEALPAELLDSLRDAVLVYRLDGTVRGYNRRLGELFKSGRELRQELRIGAGDSHPIAPLLACWQSLLDGQVRTVLFRLAPAAGPAVELELFARRLAQPDEDLILVELRDMTAARRAERALQDSKRQLEAAVAVRTRDLQQKLVLIEQQRQTLLELSTPVIQVWDGILVVPLIGAISHGRAEQLTENLLESITSTRARQVIVDITGVPSVEEAGAAAILRAVRAVGLLGAECSLAGISPAVARSLIRMESDWSGNLKTFSNLQAALLSAIARRQPDAPAPETPPGRRKRGL